MLSRSVIQAAYSYPAGRLKLTRRGHFFTAQSAKKRSLLIPERSNASRNLTREHAFDRRQIPTTRLSNRTCSCRECRPASPTVAATEWAVSGTCETLAEVT